MPDAASDQASPSGSFSVIGPASTPRDSSATSAAPEMAQIPAHSSADPLSKRSLHYLARGVSVIQLDPAVLEALAGLDGALVTDSSGRLIAFGAILRHDLHSLSASGSDLAALPRRPKAPGPRPPSSPATSAPSSRSAKTASSHASSTGRGSGISDSPHPRQWKVETIPQNFLKPRQSYLAKVYHAAVFYSPQIDREWSSVQPERPRRRFCPIRARRMRMSRRSWYGLILLTAAMAAGGRGVEAAEPDLGPGAAQVGLAARLSGPRSDEPKPAKTLPQQLTAIRAEFDAAEKKASAEAEKARSQPESWKIYSRLMPDPAVFSRRMVDLAATEPQNPAARDALLWVIDKPGMGPAGPYSDEFNRAVLMLLRDHPDDPEVARVGLGLSNLCSPARDLFLEGLYVRAKGHEARGLACIALAEYLQQKAKSVEWCRNARGPAQTRMRMQTLDEGGKLVEKDVELPPEQLAYRLHLRLSDPEAIRLEARRLFDEVIKDHGDVPYATKGFRDLEAMLKQPAPAWNGRPLTPEELRQAERMLAHKKTLADVARARLDEMENLVGGKPAPLIEGSSIEGKPMKLSDYRGKVVVLVFWGTWCGPCMQEVPHERELAERFKGRPFALLGVDCEADKAAAIKVMKEQGITWPNWNDGDPGEGPIASRYHVRAFPTIMLIDAKGILRTPNIAGSSLDKAIEDLVSEAEGRVAGK